MLDSQFARAPGIGGSDLSHSPGRAAQYARYRKTRRMAYVIAEPCVGVKDTACVDACPVDCIHPKKDASDFDTETQLYIDPMECIDCGACVRFVRFPQSSAWRISRSNGTASSRSRRVLRRRKSLTNACNNRSRGQARSPTRSGCYWTVIAHRPLSENLTDDCERKARPAFGRRNIGGHWRRPSGIFGRQPRSTQRTRKRISFQPSVASGRPTSGRITSSRCSAGSTGSRTITVLRGSGIGSATK